MFEVQLVIINDFGEFLGAKAQLSEEQLLIIKESSKAFYTSYGFELTCEDGVFVVFPPEIVKKSILKVLSKKIDV